MALTRSESIRHSSPQNHRNMNQGGLERYLVVGEAVEPYPDVAAFGHNARFAREVPRSEQLGKRQLLMMTADTNDCCGPWEQAGAIRGVASIVVLCCRHSKLLRRATCLRSGRLVPHVRGCPQCRRHFEVEILDSQPLLVCSSN